MTVKLAWERSFWLQFPRYIVSEHGRRDLNGIECFVYSRLVYIFKASYRVLLLTVVTMPYRKLGPLHT